MRFWVERIGRRLRRIRPPADRGRAAPWRTPLLVVLAPVLLILLVLLALCGLIASFALLASRRRRAPSRASSPSADAAPQPAPRRNGVVIDADYEVISK